MEWLPFLFQLEFVVDTEEFSGSEDSSFEVKNIATMPYNPATANSCQVLPSAAAVIEVTTAPALITSPSITTTPAVTLSGPVMTCRFNDAAECPLTQNPQAPKQWARWSLVNAPTPANFVPQRPGVPDCESKNIFITRFDRKIGFIE